MPQSTHIYIYIRINRKVHIGMLIRLSFCHSVCLSVCLTKCLTVCLPVCLPVYLSFFLYEHLDLRD